MTPNTTHSAVTIRGQERTCLAFLLFVPRAREKSAHMLAFRRLREFGWKPTVVTLADDDAAPASVPEDWHGVSIIRAPGVGGAHRPPLERVSAALSLPDRFRSASGTLGDLGLELLERQSFNAVLSLYYPFTSHLVARRLAAQANLPWVAMTKDYFSWPDHLTPWATRPRNWIKRRYEQRMLARASAVLAVNDNITDYLRSLLPQVPVRTLAHCHDSESIPTEAGSGPPSPDRPFTLVSVGRTTRSEVVGLDRFFECLKGVIQSHPELTGRILFRFIGHGGRIVRECAARHGCERLVVVEEPVAHHEAMRALEDADALVFQQAPWGTRRRLPEYLATRKPILAFPHYEGAMSERILSEYGGSRLVTDAASLGRSLSEWVRTRHTEGHVRVPVNEDLIAQFSARRRAEELATVLDRVTAPSALRAANRSVSEPVGA